jgi:Transposase, Mutator family
VGADPPPVLDGNTCLASGEGVSRLVREFIMAGDEPPATFQSRAAQSNQARDDILAFTSFPPRGLAAILRNNTQERLNKKIRLRADVVGIFPAATPSSARSVGRRPSRTTNRPSPAAIWARKSSSPAGKPPRPTWGRTSLVRQNRQQRQFPLE